MIPVELLDHPSFLYVITLIVGLLIGSFLNVVIYRLPLMLARDWREQCEAFLRTHTPVETGTPFNLCLPLSHCPQCKHAIALWWNIPILSYLLLRGKCHYCHANIAWRYPVMEGITALFTVFIVWHFGFTAQAGAALIFTWALLALTHIDLRHQLLPDQITLPLLWFGLFCNLFQLFTLLQDAVIGALAGYLSLWTVAKLFTLCTHKQGMGHGDFKLFAAIGAWLGWTLLPITLFFASFVGALVGIGLILSQRLGRREPMPFGPYLALAGFLALIYGDTFTHYYLQWMLR